MAVFICQLQLTTVDTLPTIRCANCSDRNRIHLYNTQPLKSDSDHLPSASPTTLLFSDVFPATRKSVAS